MGFPIVSPLQNLIVRVLTIIILFISLTILVTDNVKYKFEVDLGLDSYLDTAEIKFNDFYAYRYMLSVMIIGLAWIILQSAFIIFRFSSGIPFGIETLAHVEFYCDKVISYMLGTGAAAGFGFTVDAKRADGLDSSKNDFYNKANAAAALLCISFLLSAISSVFSSYNLPKTVPTDNAAV